MPSFDVVNTIDMQEIDNAVNMVKRDIATRYDFRDTGSSIELSKSDKSIIIKTDTDFRIDIIKDMLQTRTISRKVSLKTFEYGNIEKATGMTARLKVDLKEGISKDKAKEINTFIKNMKLKVNSQIQGEQLRVTAKKIDDLQHVMSELRSSKIEIPMQFVNMKK